MAESLTPSESYSFIMRVEIENKVGMLGRVTTVIGAAGGDIGAVDLSGFGRGTVIRDITIKARGVDHAHKIIDAVKALEGVKIVNVSDMTFLIHLGGKIEIKNKIPIKTRGDLSMAYTPGVARVCNAIARDKRKAHTLTIKRNTVAVVTDGTAVLGLGDIGPEAAMPVMEGKAMLFKEFADIDAWPICLATTDVDEIVRTVKYIAPGFGGINLEDISSPRCFEIEERLKQELDIPVFHDDQHGTAVVVLAALINALKIVKKRMEDLKVVVAGVGASGVAVSKILLNAGVRNIIGVDRRGAIYRGRKEHMNFMKEWYAEHTNPEMLKGKISDVIEGADVFIGLSGPGLITPADLKKMARDPIVFALANPDPEIMPEEAAPYVRIMATGRSDYPNQINNVLCFPGIFRGALDARASTINEEMKLAAAYAIASCVSDSELYEDYIIPSVFNRKVVSVVAKEVSRAAHRTKVARRTSKTYMEIHID
ncbi:MAG: NAD-dependent malic enzyme [Deltaproteobacteria bacterium]|nr:MAG: NAD-dependent malic enzyme [Deltaproteobacteria bacterium]